MREPCVLRGRQPTRWLPKCAAAWPGALKRPVQNWEFSQSISLAIGVH